MAQISFKLREIPRIPLEIENFNPASVVKVGESKLNDLEVYEGNRVKKTSDFFDISGTIAEKTESQTVIIENSCNMLRRIGYEMMGGRIVVEGDSGSQTGCYMKEGKITIKGNTGSYAGLEIKGGKITIEGNAGEFLGGAYWGSRTGMTGGEIIVNGDVGNETGSWIKGGNIQIKGTAGDFLGFHSASKKSYIITNAAGLRSGGQMTSGNIVILDPDCKPLPSFIKKENVTNVIVGEKEIIKGEFVRYTGDHAERKKAIGNLYIKL